MNKLTDAAAAWIDEYVKCYDESHNIFPRARMLETRLRLSSFFYYEDGKVVFDDERAKLESKKTDDPSEGLRQIIISGKCKDFRDSSGKIVKFGDMSGEFSIFDCPLLVDLEGIPDEIFSDYDGNSICNLYNCSSLREWKSSYLAKGCGTFEIRNCKNLREVEIAEVYEYITLQNLTSLKKVKTHSSWGNFEFFMENCNEIEIENLDLPDIATVNIVKCQSIGVELEEENGKLFNKLKNSKNLQMGKNLGLF
jgi:hypothetical protein